MTGEKPNGKIVASRLACAAASTIFSHTLLATIAVAAILFQMAS